MQNSGIIVGCDQQQEWMLPWWWKHYSTHNNLPVVFIDFGLSPQASQWCQLRGKVIPLLFSPPLKSRAELNLETVARWETAFGTNFWKARSSWFKKPLALLHTPFEKTLWLDVDCEVKSDLSSLFSGFTTDLSLTSEPEFCQQHLLAHSLREPTETIYNSGVILYRHGCPIILRWAQATLQSADAFWSDQHLLSRIIHEHQHPIIALSQLYNWHMNFDPHPQRL